MRESPDANIRIGDTPFFTRLALGYAALIVYGTLFSQHGWHWNGSLASIIPRWPTYIAKTDVLINVLVYIPFGFLVTLALQKRLGFGLAIAAASTLGAALSFSLECTQNFLPGRDPSLLDVVLNTAGGIGGALLSTLSSENLALGKRFHSVKSRLFVSTRSTNVGLTVLGLWALSQLLPLVPSLDAGTLRHGVAPLWQTIRNPDLFHAQQALSYCLALTGLGLLGTRLLKPGQPAVLLFSVFALLVLGAKVPILMQQLSMEMLVGLVCAVLLLMLSQQLTPRATIATALFCVLLSYLSQQLYTDGTGMLRPGFNWMPFVAQMAKVSGLIDILQAAWPFAAAAYLSLLLLRRHSSVLLAATGASVFACVFGTEWLQQYLPGRRADITDVLVATSAWIITWSLTAQALAHEREFVADHAPDDPR